MLGFPALVTAGVLPSFPGNLTYTVIREKRLYNDRKKKVLYIFGGTAQRIFSVPP